MYTINPLRISKKGEMDWTVMIVIIIVLILLYILLRNG
mgnify:FL=1